MILFTIAAASFLVSTILYFVFVSLRRERLEDMAFVVFIVGTASLLAGTVMRWIAAGHAPLSNLYESMVFFALVLALLYIFLRFKLGIRALGLAVVPLVFLILGIASNLPEQYTKIRPLVPALQSYWLTIHVVTCFIAYAGFAVAFGTGIMYLVARRKEGGRLPAPEVLDEISYRSVALGFPFLSLGIITGAVWAKNAWGAYWSWDPKETWALVTWLVYSVYLHTRLLKGWKGRRSAWLSVAGFVTVIFTYFGVNLLLSGLHSY